MLKLINNVFSFIFMMYNLFSWISIFTKVLRNITTHSTKSNSQSICVNVLLRMAMFVLHFCVMLRLILFVLFVISLSEQRSVWRICCLLTSASCATVLNDIVIYFNDIFIIKCHWTLLDTGTWNINIILSVLLLLLLLLSLL